jgi:hypothetical protein
VDPYSEVLLGTQLEQTFLSTLWREPPNSLTQRH